MSTASAISSSSRSVGSSRNNLAQTREGGASRTREGGASRTRMSADACQSVVGECVLVCRVLGFAGLDRRSISSSGNNSDRDLPPRVRNPYLSNLFKSWSVLFGGGYQDLQFLFLFLF
eukprot:SAG31_NODE_167_length_21485_cov_31.094922_10_plen_118_part_00